MGFYRTWRAPANVARANASDLHDCEGLKYLRYSVSMFPLHASTLQVGKVYFKQASSSASAITAGRWSRRSARAARGRETRRRLRYVGTVRVPLCRLPVSAGLRWRLAPRLAVPYGGGGGYNILARMTRLAQSLGNVPLVIRN